MEIRKSAFINLWKQSPLQKSIVHAFVHSLCPICTVRTKISFVARVNESWEACANEKRRCRKETSRVAKVASEPSLRRTTTRATRVRLQLGTAFVDLKTMTAQVGLAKTDLLFEPVVAAYTPISSLFQVERHRRRDAELFRWALARA